MMRLQHWLCAAVLLLGACSGGSGGSGGGAATGSSPSNLGGPIEGLPAATLAAFERGKTLMSHEFTPSEGLGPYYNATSCKACHESPEVGGSAPAYRNFYLAAQGFPPFQGPIGTAPSIPSLVLPNFRSPPFTQARPTIPPSSMVFPVVTTQRNAPPMFGLGGPAWSPWPTMGVLPGDCGESLGCCRRETSAIALLPSRTTKIF